MDKLATIARLLVGLIFVVFGLNGFLNFIPVPPPPPEGGAFLGALAATGYFFPFLKITEIIFGALLLANKFVPLSLTVLAPIVINIFAYHFFLDRSAEGMMMPIFLVAALAFLGHVNREKFLPMLQA